MIIVPPHLLVTVETHGTYLLHNGHDTHHVWHTLLLRVWRCIGLVCSLRESQTIKFTLREVHAVIRTTPTYNFVDMLLLQHHLVHNLLTHLVISDSPSDFIHALWKRSLRTPWLWASSSESTGFWHFATNFSRLFQLFVLVTLKYLCVLCVWNLWLVYFLLTLVLVLLTRGHQNQIMFW